LNQETKLSLPILQIKDSPIIMDLNTAPIEFLMTIPGVDFSRATAIDQWRRTQGGFKAFSYMAGIEQLDQAIINVITEMNQAYLKLLKEGEEQLH
jgi:DNA uptake protein ComE-like DNA-binding protein